VTVFKAVGKNFSKPDAKDKVTGKTTFVEDVGLLFPDRLIGKIFRSSVPHAKILSIDIQEALSIPGVEAVITARDIPGENSVGWTRRKDQKVFAETRVRFHGEAIAAVAATTREIAEHAIRKIKVVYAELPVIESVEEALRPDAPRIGDEGNLCVYRKIEKGNWQQGLNDSDLIVEGEYRTQMAEHAYLETESAFAVPMGGGVLLWSSTKSVHVDKKEVARVLGLPEELVEVVTPAVGGSFGGKSDLVLNAITALLCLKTKKPVLISYNREESISVTTKRHPCIIKSVYGVKRNGSILAAKIEIIADVGAYVDYSEPVLTRMAIHAAGPYRIPNLLIEVKGVHTNKPSCGAMRGFGVPQVNFASERQMDRIAKVLDMDPFELRLKNILTDGDTTATGQVLERVDMRSLINTAKERVLQEKDRERMMPYERAAWGIACCYYGNGRTGMPNPGVAKIALNREGFFEIFVGSPDIGQGSNTIFSQIAAEALGLANIDYIKVRTGDTRCTPDSGTTSGTRLTAIVGRAVQKAAEKLRKVILNELSRNYSLASNTLRIGETEERLAFLTEFAPPILLREFVDKVGKEFVIEEVYNPPVTSLDDSGQGSPYASYTYGVQCAKVKVNIYTGKITVQKVIACYDAGTIINPSLFKGQVEGGIIMGIGYAITEEIRLSRGVITNNNFDRYLVPTSMDIPEIEVLTAPFADSEGPYGAKGIGEPAVIPTAAAIANAVSRALGVEVFNLPLSLEEVTKRLERVEEDL